MITSSHFFNKSLFNNHDDEIVVAHSQEMGPWVEEPKPLRYSTMETKQKKE